MTGRGRTAVSAPRPSGGPGGFTLLEVLVSLGIIIGALAGIAALLPAAGSRLADATDIDRAGTMVANARADLANRRVVTRSLWAGSTPAVVFGEGLPALATLAPASSSVGLANLSGQAPTFVLQDGTAAGGAPGVCYGCMLSSTAAPSGAGAPVRMTTVVFRKPAPAVQGFTLRQTGTNSTVFTLGPGGAAADDRRRFLSGCSWVLATGAGEPRWFQIASSWTAFAPGVTSGAATGTSFVSLRDVACLQLVSGGTLQVFGFEGLLRLDERTVNLE